MFSACTIQTTISCRYIIILIVIPLIAILPFWKIFAKAGYNGALSLLMIVPLVNLIMLFFLAFADWPILKRQGGY
ncbi:MAG: hypothetical protein H6642_00275 [Caldilineaceae bacterium]|nr:hypothetical protein [Caldilineaceae bacterium]